MNGRPLSPPSNPWTGWRRGLALALGAGLVWGLCFRFPMVWDLLGIGQSQYPFLDLYGLLAGDDAVRLGMNPFLPNHLDPYNRPHIYSTWWFGLGELGLGRKDTLWLGVVFALILLVTALAVVRASTGRDSRRLFLLLVSPAFLLAVNRANNDLVVLIPVGLGLLCLDGERPWWRALGFALLAVAAVLKYYPLITLVLLVDARNRRELAVGLGVYLLVLVLAWPGLKPGLEAAAKHSPVPTWLYAFGAPVLLRDFDYTRAVGWIVPGVLLAGWAAVAGWRRAAPLQGPVAASWSAREREFVCGAAIIVGLFFIGASFVYKLVFAVWLLPWLWADTGEGPERRWRRVTWELLLALVWVEGGMAAMLNFAAPYMADSASQFLLKATLVVAQVLTWLFIACLMRFLAIMLLGQAGRLWRAG